MFRSLPRSARRGGVVKCTVARASQETESRRPPRSSSGRAGRAGSAARARKGDALNLTFRCQRGAERNGIIYSELPN